MSDVYKTCKITYNNSITYFLWIIEFVIVFYGLLLFHESLHWIYCELSGGKPVSITLMNWVLFVPVLQTTIIGGNQFLEVEGVLLTTWIVSLTIVILTSYQFLSIIKNKCDAMNLSGKLFGFQIGAIVKMFGEGVYALPSFTFPQKNYIVLGDGTSMYYWFIQHGYSGQIQYFIAFLMIFASFCVLIWVLKCHEIFCSKCIL